MKKAFSYGNRRFEVQAAFIDEVWLLSVYENDVPAGGPQYQVDGSTELCAEGSDLMESLMTVVAEDFRRSSERAKATKAADPAAQAEVTETVIDGHVVDLRKRAPKHS